MLKVSGIRSVFHHQNSQISTLSPKKISSTCKARFQQSNKILSKSKVPQHKNQHNIIYDSSIFSDSKYLKQKEPIYLNEINDQKKIQIAMNRDIVIRKIKQKIQTKQEDKNSQLISKKAKSLCQIFNDNKIQHTNNITIQICFQKQLPESSNLCQSIKDHSKYQKLQQQKNTKSIQKNQPVLPQFMKSLMKPCVIQKASFSKRPVTTRLVPYRRKFSDCRDPKIRMNKTAICQFRKSPIFQDLRLKIQPWMSQQDL